MTTEFVAVPASLTAAQTIDRLRELEPNAETIYYVYVTDDDGKLVGVLSLRDLIVAKPNTQISTCMYDEPVAVKTDASQEEVTEVVARYNLLAVPVVDEEGHLEGHRHRRRRHRHAAAAPVEDQDAAHLRPDLRDPGAVRARVLSLTPRAVNRVRLAAILGVLGPGLVSGFADNDAGGISTYSVAGARYGYELLWVLLASQIVLFFTQEVGARLGLATGQGLAGVVRERFGVRWATFMISAMLVANVGSIVSEFAGCGAALGLFGVPHLDQRAARRHGRRAASDPRQYRSVQYLFVVVGIGVSLAYFVSAVLAHPDWGHAARSLVMPGLASSPAYWLAVVATVGTTITPWGQAFIQSYFADKRLGPEDLLGERLDVGLGALLTNLIAAFIVVACAAAVWSARIEIDTSVPGRGRRRSPSALSAAGRLEAQRSCSPWACWRRRSWASASCR